MLVFSRYCFIANKGKLAWDKREIAVHLSDLPCGSVCTRHAQIGTVAIHHLLSFRVIDIDIFVNCNWVDTRWQ